MISNEDQEYLRYIYRDRKKSGPIDSFASFELLYCLARRVKLPFSEISDIAHQSDFNDEETFVKLADKLRAAFNLT
jgi:hypothetical protein